MGVVLFDTHAFIKRLTAAGMPEAQAEVLADEQARLIDERLATKADLAPLALKADKADLAPLALKADKADLAPLALKADKADLIPFATKVELAEMEGALRTAIAESKADVLKWMFGAIGFQTLVLLGAIVALAKALH